MRVPWMAVFFLFFLVLLALRFSAGPRRAYIAELLEADPCYVVAHPFSRSHYVSLMEEHHQRQARLLPRFTKRGWFLTRLPTHLWEGLAKVYESKRASSAHRPEMDPSAVEFLDEATRPVMTDIERAPEEKPVREWLLAALRGWSGVERLTHSKTYGVRSYRRGSKLKPHVDRLKTHVLSAIVHVSRAGLQQEWPLEVAPHDSDSVASILMPGEANCLLYESATLPHGRLQPLVGDEYSNIFFHFAPREWCRVVDRLGL